MSFLSRTKEVTGHLAAGRKRRAVKGKLELKVRRLESKMSSEKDSIGQVLIPLLEARTVQVALPEVHERMTAIAQLLRELGERRAEIEALCRPEPATGEEARSESARNVNHNATAEVCNAGSGGCRRRGTRQPCCAGRPGL